RAAGAASLRADRGPQSVHAGQHRAHPPEAPGVPAGADRPRLIARSSFGDLDVAPGITRDASVEDQFMRWLQPRFLAFATMLALVAAAPALAVTRSAGVIAGFSYSNLNIQGSSGLDGRGSFAGGGVLDLGVNDKFGIRVEPMFV